ncbi:MAG TPA: rRNA maturation RNase YbeY [Rhodobacteraceae bacterium]|nr:rRNA maturation RNase YbeY [Paracoccaceae bacterium]
MLIEVLVEEPLWRDADLEALAGRACGAVLGHLGLAAAQAEISLLGCDDRRIAALNRQFRDKPAATNVLSWPSGWQPGMPVGELGDIAIAYQTCAREARDQGKDLDDHVTHLLVHATLHLLGYDHMHEKEAALMEGLEAEILGILGISDPYEA